MPASVRNLKRTGVSYQRLNGRPAQIELGILRIRDSADTLGQRFVTALQEAAQAVDG